MCYALTPPSDKDGKRCFIQNFYGNWEAVYKHGNIINWETLFEKRCKKKKVTREEIEAEIILSGTRGKTDKRQRGRDRHRDRSIYPQDFPQWPPTLMVYNCV